MISGLLGDLHRPAWACFLEIGGDFCTPLPTSRHVEETLDGTALYTCERCQRVRNTTA